MALSGEFVFVVFLNLLGTRLPNYTATRAEPFTHPCHFYQLLQPTIIMDCSEDLSNCLIIVCAHAVYHGKDPFDETHWGLQPFQRSTDTKQSEHITFIHHVEHGANLLLKNRGKNSILIFSGGHTNVSFPNISEAEGYYRIANHVLPRLDQKIESDTIALEDNATDTFQNILFSILKFYNLKQQYPDKIIVVTHEFKRERVLLHRAAIGWNKPFEVHGIDPEFDGMY
jgi:hypothetical protein